MTDRVEQYFIPPRYSPVAPIKLLQKMHQEERIHKVRILGNYLLLLAHDVLAHPKKYGKLIQSVRDCWCINGDTFIIMDNSLVELGTAMSAEDVIAAADIVEADCIMTPDALGGSEDTMDLVREQRDELLSSGYPLMRVPQGATTQQLVECVNWLRVVLPTEAGEPEYWGVPRWIANELGSRIPIVQYISSTRVGEGAMEHVGDGDGAMIHLLGMSENSEDDMRCAKLPDVIGIDSANPLVAGIAGHDLEFEAPIHLPRGDYWDEKRLGSLSVANVRHVHDLLAQP